MLELLSAMLHSLLSASYTVVTWAGTEAVEKAEVTNVPSVAERRSVMVGAQGGCTARPRCTRPRTAHSTQHITAHCKAQSGGRPLVTNGRQYYSMYGEEEWKVLQLLNCVPFCAELLMVPFLTSNQLGVVYANSDGVTLDGSEWGKVCNFSCQFGFNCARASYDNTSVCTDGMTEKLQSVLSRVSKVNLAATDYADQIFMHSCGEYINRKSRWQPEWPKSPAHRHRFRMCRYCEVNTPIREWVCVTQDPQILGLFGANSFRE